ncbi:MAG: hypothetical protein HOC71_10520 [Candidatus Latescibacteria bacterium]|jgi:hypothetical protein|nr:hypothetical protein [Candidatus Latescibacterota bacterium]
MGLFQNILGRNRRSYRSNYSINLPNGLLTNVLNEFCTSRSSILLNHEVAGQAGCPIIQDDLDKCLGVMETMINQRISQSKAQKEMLEEQANIIRSELSRPIIFNDIKDEEPSLINDIIKLKEKIVLLKKGG